MKIILKNKIISLLFLSLLLTGCTGESVSSVSTYEDGNYYKPSIVETKSIPNIKSPSEKIDYCCKHCSKGKACGDSCISRSYTCHKAPGCACDY